MTQTDGGGGTLDVTVVIPAYNEEEVIEPCVREVLEVMRPTGKSFEVVVIDDGSRDRTREILKGLKPEMPELVILGFKGNHGETAGWDAGFKAARGKVVVTIDADMQNDPHDIPQLLEGIGEFDVVTGYRRVRNDSIVRRISSRIANWTRNKMTNDDIRDVGCSLRAMRRECLEGLKLYKGMHRFLPTLLKYRRLDGHAGARQPPAARAGHQQVRHRQPALPRHTRPEGRALDARQVAALRDRGAHRMTGEDARRYHTGRDVLVLVGLVLLATMPGMFTRDLWDPDEPRYAEVAREMVVLDNYLIPHLDNQVYAEKPPMFFWMTAGFWKIGAGYNSGRFVTVLAVLGILLLVYFAARQYLGGPGALLASAAALSTFLLSYLARRGVIDPLLVFFTTAAALAGYQALQPGTRRRALCWLGCYAAMGLGTLEKGPVAFLVPGLVLIVYGILERRRVKGGGWVHLAGVALLLAISLAWVVPACRAGGKAYTDTILFSKQFGQAVESTSHRQPVYYYLYNGVAALWPWILLLPLGAVAAFRLRRNGEAPLAFFATMWLIVTFVFFSAISIKRMNYLLPMVPAAGLLAAWYFTTEGVRQGGLLKWERVLTTIGLTSTLLAGLALLGCMVAVRPVLGRLQMNNPLGLSPQDIGHMEAFFTPVRGAVGALLALLAVGAAVLGLRTAPDAGRSRAVFICAAMLLLFLPVDVVMNPALNFAKSGRTFGQEIKKAASRGKTVYLYEENFSGLYNLYSGIVDMPQISGEAQLKQVLGSGDAVVVGEAKQISKVLNPFQLMRYLVLQEGVGHRQMMLLKGVGPRGQPAAKTGAGAGLQDPARLMRRTEAVGTGRVDVRPGCCPA